MSYRRKIRFEYYEVVCREHTDSANQPDRFFDLRKWIEKIGDMAIESRILSYYQEKARLDKFWPDKVNDFWFLDFSKLRATNIPSKAKETEESIPIQLEDDEYIGENAFAIYDYKHSVLMLQRNFHSLGPRGVEYYINSIWDSDTEEIYLRPILSLDVQSRARKAPIYRKFKVRFADVHKNEIDGQGPLKSVFDGLKKYGAVNAEMTVTMGYERGGALDNSTVRDAINEVVENKGIVSGAELSLKDNENAPLEVLDLFEGKLHDFIMVNIEKRETIASEFMAIRMADQYIESRGKIIAALRERK